MRPIRVLIADDDPSMLRMLSATLDIEEGLEVVGAAEDADDAIRLADETHPDVALLDVRMPGGGGARAAREIRTRSPLTRIIVLSGSDEHAVVIEMLRAGAYGYLVKGGPVEEIVATIHDAVQGSSRLSPSVTPVVIGELTGQLEMREREQEQQRLLERRIEHAIDHGHLRVMFQPIVRLDRTETVGVEALARFPMEPSQPPDAWFDDAHLVGKREILEAVAARTAVRALPSLPPSAYLSINVSPAAASSRQVLEALEAVPPERLVIEVTEHMPVEDYPALNESIAYLRARGARLAIDDVGAGFASLRHILLLEPDVLKLDVSLTRGIDVDPARRALATAMISFAAAIDAQIVAEGIETAGELDTLRALGVRLGQGFFLGRPAAVDELRVEIRLDGPLAAIE